MAKKLSFTRIKKSHATAQEKLNESFGELLFEAKELVSELLFCGFNERGSNRDINGGDVVDAINDLLPALIRVSKSADKADDAFQIATDRLDMYQYNEDEKLRAPTKKAKGKAKPKTKATKRKGGGTYSH